jgi:hypothetical protein
MKLRNGKVIVIPTNKSCSHRCECNSSGFCCSCADKRPKLQYYVAHNKSTLEDFSIVERWHSYCKVCKDRCAAQKRKQQKPTFQELEELNNQYKYLLQKRDESIQKLTSKLNRVEQMLYEEKKKGYLIP